MGFPERPQPAGMLAEPSPCTKKGNCQKWEQGDDIRQKQGKEKIPKYFSETLFLRVFCSRIHLTGASRHFSVPTALISSHSLVASIKQKNKE